MRRMRVLPLLAAAAALWPVIHAGAGTTSGGRLVLSPATGAPGSHFTATFTYSVSRCDLYGVGLWWDDPHYTTPLGGASDSSTGDLCQVTIDAVVPSADADPGTTYPVHAYTSPHGASVDGGPGPSGTAQYTVAAPQGSGGAPTATGGPGTGAAPARTAPAATATQAASSAQTAPASDQPAAAAGQSPAAAGGGTAAGSGTATPPLTGVSTTPLARDLQNRTWLLPTVIATVLIAVAAVFVLAHRTGRLRTLRRR